MRWRALPAAIAGALAMLVLLFVLAERPGRARTSADVTVLVVDHGYHAGLIVPRAHLAARATALGLPALKDMVARFVAYEWLEVGWGDEGFYRRVPGPGALTVPLALKALFGPDNPSVLHLVGFSGAPPAYFEHSDLMRVRVDAAGFDAIARAMASSLPIAPGHVEPLGTGLYGASLFFRAAGAYHLVSNCNHWVARVLNAAGVPISMAAATLSPGLMIDLRWRGTGEAP